MTADEIGKIVIALASIGTSGTYTWRWAAAMRRQSKQRVQAEQEHAEMLAAMADAVARIEPKIEEVKHQFTMNGGSTIHAAIQEIRNDQAIERTARRAMSDTPSIEVSIRGGEMRVLFVSPAYVRITGLTREDCEHDGWVRSVVADDRARVTAAAAAAYEALNVFSTTYVVEHRHTRERVLVEHTGAPVFNYRNDVVGWFAILRPLTPGGA